MSHGCSSVARSSRLLHASKQFLRLGLILPPGARGHCPNRVTLPIHQPGGTFCTT